MTRLSLGIFALSMLCKHTKLTCILHILYLTGSPRQPAGDEQVRSCLDTPPSQVREHNDHSLHWDQPPRSWVEKFQVKIRDIITGKSNKR